MARYAGLAPASSRATAAARGASRKRDTRPELMLRRALFQHGLRYRCATSDLPGRPDLVFRRARVVVFADGDFWHGRDLTSRLAKLASGHNAAYWLAKIEGNAARDRRINAKLAALGWTVLRFWESEIKRDVHRIVREIAAVVRAHGPGSSVARQSRDNGPEKCL
jgi:DNA mismatch endonuclease, patch repair protein